MTETLELALIAFGGTILASGGATALIQHLISRKGRNAEEFRKLNGRLDNLEKSISDLEDKIDINEAQTARTQILRFSDELYNGVLHTKEHFNEVLDTCGRYNQYCAEHPEFKNMRTVNAQERINEVYKKCERDHSFLECREEKVR